MIHTLLFLTGTILGALVNLAVATMAWYPQSISPWCKAPEGFRRRWFDYLPILGWLGMKREKTATRGRFFWIRPMLVELGLGLFAVWFYDLQMAHSQILGLENLVSSVSQGGQALSQAYFHYHYAMLLVLVTLMLGASLIDTDERTIPDSLTVFGTLFALVSAAFFAPAMGPLQVSSVGLIWQPAVGESTLALSQQHILQLDLDWLCLLAGLFFWNGWCFAMTNRHWRLNHGWKLAWAIFWKRLWRTRSTRYYALLAMLGSGLILFLYTMAIRSDAGSADVSVWRWHWVNFRSALFGMGVAGGMLWAIRIVGFLGMKREALGFGDVTLVAMLGAFLGWRACVVLFFLSPFAALAVGLLMLVLRRENEIPYGPFLCLAALVVICGEFNGWIVLANSLLCRLCVDLQLAVALVLLVMMFALLRLIQLVKKLAGIEA